jgi:hypothetical protein
MIAKYNKDNFYINTFCVFREIAERLVAKPDYISKSGSVYFFSEEGVYRSSDHWGRAANCKWQLEPIVKNYSRQKMGFARWTDFHNDNETQKLYWLDLDWDNKAVRYKHKDVDEYEAQILRTSNETMKRIRQVRRFLKDWGKSGYDEKYAKQLLDKFVNSDEPLSKIRDAS